MTSAPPVEPLRSWPSGRYEDGLVVVTADGKAAPRAPARAGSRPSGGRAVIGPGSRYGTGPARAAWTTLTGHLRQADAHDRDVSQAAFGA